MSKVLAWSALVTVLLFAIVSSVGLLAWDSLGAGTARGMIMGGIFLLIASILLAVSILVVESLSVAAPAETAAVTPAEPRSTTPLFADLPAAEEAAEPALDVELPAEPATDTDDDF